MPTHFPTVTVLAAALLGLIFTALSVRVVTGRNSSKIMLGEGASSAPEAQPLLVAIRSHANFAEFVPICLIMLAGLEARSGQTVLVEALAIVLVLSRIAHPIGIGMPSPNPFRAAGFVGTLLVLSVTSLALLAGFL